MNNLIVFIGTAIGSLIIGSILGYYTRQTIAKKQAGTIESKLNKLIIDAKNEAKETLFRAKEKAGKILDEIKQEDNIRQRQQLQAEERLTRKEQYVDQRNSQMEKDYSKFKLKVHKIKKIKEELIGLKDEQVKKLENISQLTREQAKEELLTIAEKGHQKILMERIQRMEKEGKEELNKKAQGILVLAMQRYAASQSSEITTTSVDLPNDELKGRIIGKEGRNIKTLERITGVEILVDETPGMIVVSGFDPIRRQIAKLALDRLIQDGRIQPARIEEMVEKAHEEISEKIKEAGEAAVYDVGIAGLDPQLIKLLGRLRFRTSYGQNMLLHSLEVAHLAGTIASELGSNVSIAKKAGLFHDIGKAVDHEIQGSHVEIGRKILKKFNAEEEVIVAMQSHHEEYPYESLEAFIVQVADAVSSARPGARKDTVEAYLKRLESLENIANSFAGVEKAYAIQAGREVRVFVRPDKISDLEAHKLARDIAEQIHQELRYPGEIKINVIRETRVTEYAR